MSNTSKKIFALVAGILYVGAGLLQILERFGIQTGLADLLLIPPDFFGGFCFVVIGAVFLYGFKELTSGDYLGVSYVYVGIVLALIFMAVYLLIIGAGILGLLIQSGEYEGWTIIDGIRPGIYLGFLALAGYIVWRDNFSTSLKNVA
ncbi:hypothetical protein V7O62_00285 [Methanolobus sp. ZRKC2]|uniref:hypothetical protein n=1 Tax=Methanolobus sp. ZRKC2 TaxID=3125783 RepID=UPI0032558EC8